MQRVVLASANPVKVHATLAGFRRVFPEVAFSIESVSVPSGVAAQPLTDAETLQGARTRAENAAQQVADADYWVGMEGGVDEVEGDMLGFAWVVVRSRHGSGMSRTAAFILPPRVAALVREGRELGEAVDIVYDRVGTKQGLGAVGLLTDGLIDRSKLYEPAVVLALLCIDRGNARGS